MFQRFLAACRFLLIIPVVVIMSGAIGSAILGESMYRDGRARNEGSELLDLPD